MRVARLALLAIFGMALLLVAAPLSSQDGPTEPLLCLQVFNDGAAQASLTIVAATGDNAVDCEVARNFVPATGTFEQVTVLLSPLNTTVGVENHWVRARNADGPSAFVSCESYERKHSVTTPS